MQKSAETTVEPGLVLEGTATEATGGSSESCAVAAPKAQSLQHAPAPIPMALDPMAVIHIMERLAKNKEVDIGKMKEAREMMQSIIADHNEGQFNEAMAAAQQEMEPVRANAVNDHTSSTYASEAALDRAIRPIYTRHGFSLSFDTEPGAVEGYVRVLCYCSCRGHTRTYKHDVAADGKGAKGGDVMTKTHAGGSALTYGRRYLKRLIFDIPVAKDDDGNAASGPTDDRPKLSPKQVDALIEKCEAVGCPRPKFLKWVAKDMPKGTKLDKIEDIPAELFDGCMGGLDSFKKGS